MSDSHRRAEAARVVSAVAERLADPDVVRDKTIQATGDGDPQRSIWRDLTLSAGFPAAAVLFAELAAHDPAKWGPALHGHLKAAIPAARDSDVDGLFGGRAALSVGFRMANAATGGYTAALRDIDDAVAHRLRHRLHAGLPEPEQLTFSDFDVVAGLSGLLGHLLDNLDQHRDLAARTAQELANMCLRDSDRPGWWVSHGPNPYRAGPVGGHGNPSLSHGAAGVLAALAKTGLAGVEVSGLSEAVDRLGGWLMSLPGVNAMTPMWPKYVVADGTAADAVPLEGQLSWCYGAPGIAIALRAAARLRRRPDWEEFGTRAVDTAWQSAPHMSDAGLCHGWAGLAHTLWRLDATRYEPVINAAIDATLDSYDPETVFGFRCAGRDGPLDHPGLLEGAAGTALALQRFASNESPRTSWDTVLMLSATA